MTETDDGGPAFPHVAHENTVGVVEGATLRDFFAAHVSGDCEVGGIENAARIMGEAIPTEIEDIIDLMLRLQARLRYRYADAMLAERERAGGEG